jgi:hypothetical protein
MKRHPSTMKRLLFVMPSFMLLCATPAPGDDPLQPRYSRLAAGTGAFDWEGGTARTDFVQWTDTLGTWRYLPLLRHGDAPKSIGVASDTPCFFLRVFHTDQAIPEGLTAETADFDNDGFTNLYEVLNGRDPMVPETVLDGDADGAADSTEQARGTDPGHEDHPAVGLSVTVGAP